MRYYRGKGLNSFILQNRKQGGLTVLQIRRKQAGKPGNAMWPYCFAMALLLCGCGSREKEAVKEYAHISLFCDVDF